MGHFIRTGEKKMQINKLKGSFLVAIATAGFVSNVSKANELTISDDLITEANQITESIDLRSESQEITNQKINAIHDLLKQAQEKKGIEQATWTENIGR